MFKADEMVYRGGSALQIYVTPHGICRKGNLVTANLIVPTYAPRLNM